MLRWMAGDLQVRGESRTALVSTACDKAHHNGGSHARPICKQVEIVGTRTRDGLRFRLYDGEMKRGQRDRADAFSCCETEELESVGGVAAAMLVQPIRRARPMARLRRLAMMRGAVPVRTREASSR